LLKGNTLNIEPPKQDEIDIALIGGNGYGESSVIHLGEGKWGIIDALINKDTGRPAALDYLDWLNQPYTNVAFIVLTHYHRDHSHGILETVKECVNAKVFIPQAFGGEEFLNLIDRVTVNYSPLNPFKEIGDLFRYLDDSATQEKKYLKQDSPIYIGKLGKEDLSIVALSPNDATINLFLSGIARQNSKDLSSLVTKENPNLLSIAFVIKVGDRCFLFASDLEIHSSNNKLGLPSILNTFAYKNVQSILFKIPHHGSQNGFDINLWQTLLDQEKVMLIGTPFNRLKHESKLPTEAMQKAIISFSENSFITSDPRVEKKNKLMGQDSKKILKKLQLETLSLVSDLGIIRVFLNNNGILEPNLVGNAIPFTSLKS